MVGGRPLEGTVRISGAKNASLPALCAALLTDEPVRVHNKVVSDGSCLHAQTVEPGRGAFRFDDGTTVAYTFEFTYAGTDGVITFRGDQSGGVATPNLQVSGLSRRFGAVSGTLNNIAGGTYQLQILDGADRTINTINLTVIDGQRVQVDV